MHGTTLYYAYDRFAVNSRLHFQSSCHISLTELYTIYRHVYRHDVLVSTVHPVVKWWWRDSVIPFHSDLALKVWTYGRERVPEDPIGEERT